MPRMCLLHVQTTAREVAPTPVSWVQTGSWQLVLYWAIVSAVLNVHLVAARAWLRCAGLVENKNKRLN